MAIATLVGTKTAKAGVLELRPLTFRIGAEIVGADLSQDLSDDTVAEIRAALLAHRVVFFRNQNIGIEEQTAFARRLGEVTSSHPTVSGTNAAQQVYEIDSTTGARADEWHTDVTFCDRPPAISVLRAVVIPPYGGDTMWANTVGAYADLPEAFRGYLDSLRVIHSNNITYADFSQMPDEATRKHFEEFSSVEFVTEQPLVRVHPETKERSFLLGSFAQRIVDLSPRASADMLRLLADHITTPENTVRWRWQPGDVAMWDNRATQHYAVHDYGDTHRKVQRVTVAGAIPVGVDGRKSIPISGDASAYSVVGKV